MTARVRRIHHLRSVRYWSIVAAAMVVGKPMVAAFGVDDTSVGTRVLEKPHSFESQPQMRHTQALTPLQDQKTADNAVCTPEHIRIALDVGHTPEATGATSARGVKEHLFNQQLAKHIENRLVHGGFTNTTLITVHGVGRDQLRTRVERVNALDVDLLLSIHHDDVQAIYYSKWKYNGSLRNYSDKFSGYSLFVSQNNQHFDKSLTFAQLLGRQLSAQGLRFSPHHAEPIAGESREIIDATAGIYRYDDLYVLKFSTAPAVLLEAGIIVNRDDELALSSSERQDKISDAILAALKEFCGVADR
jgi:N-acetylmuramoyl-L-alanine amidase